MPRVIYKASPGANFGDDRAKVYGARISKLAKDSGSVTPQVVLNDARDTKSPLHDYFEWNNTTAAEKWRIFQARQLISHISVEIVNNGKTEDIRYFFSVSDECAEAPPVYVSLNTIMSDDNKRAEVVAYAKRELKGWTKRYKQYSELNELTQFIETHA